MKALCLRSAMRQRRAFPPCRLPNPTTPNSLHQSRFALLEALCYRDDWIMNSIQNSGRKKVPRNSAGTSTVLVRPDASIASHRCFDRAARPPAPPAHIRHWIRLLGFNFLIANAGLEFPLTPFTCNHLKFSNREYIAVFRSAFPSTPSSPHDIHAPNLVRNSRSLIAHHLTLITSFLVGTLGLEFPVTHRKQSSALISNRDTLAHLHRKRQPHLQSRCAPSGAARGSLITRHPSLVPLGLAILPPSAP
jgi:hypothetical protein